MPNRPEPHYSPTYFATSGTLEREIFSALNDGSALIRNGELFETFRANVKALIYDLTGERPYFPVEDADELQEFVEGAIDTHSDDLTGPENRGLRAITSFLADALLTPDERKRKAKREARNAKRNWKPEGIFERRDHRKKKISAWQEAGSRARSQNSARRRIEVECARRINNWTRETSGTLAQKFGVDPSYIRRIHKDQLRAQQAKN